MKKVLLINAHLAYPNWSEGTLNQAFVNKAKDFFQTKNIEVLETKIEAGYRPEEEVEKHLQADLVILQTPVNWFGAPWIYKKYVDEVFNSGLHSQKLLSGDGRTREDVTKQYGSGGKMQGRKFMICATFNAPKRAFGNPEQHLMKGKTTGDLFLNITCNYAFSGYQILEDYCIFDIFKDPDIARYLEDYPLHLQRVLEL